MDDLKKLLLVMLLILVTSTDIYAVPAAPHFHELQQPDGSTIVARQWGDEHSHGWETEAGHTIVFDEKLKGWAYAAHDSSGRLTTSSVLVDNSAIVPNVVRKRIRPLKSSSVSLAPSISNNATTRSFQTTGTKNIPVILINFSDTSFLYTAADFESLLFGDSSNSMKKYYLENSYNQLSLTSGPSGVVGPFNSSDTHNYYGQDIGGSGNDAHAAELVNVAIQKAVGAGFKFAPYVDQTTSCTVDSVTIVHQGTGQEAGGATTDIWSHSWELSSALGSAYVTNEPCSLGGKIKVDHYVIQPERLGDGMTTFGVFAHEYGHSLGLPDLYDTTYSSSGAGDWSIMAGGSWLGKGGDGYGGDSPAHFDVWSKYFLGWKLPIVITGINTNVPIAAASSTSPDFYMLGAGTPLSGEYFLVENRQKTGFDSYLPGAGLLVWHIDGNSITQLFSSNTVNDFACTSTIPGACAGLSTHYGVALIQADNLLSLEKNSNMGSVVDPFFSPRFFADSTAPNSKLWSGAASGWSVTSISSPAATMTATLAGTPIAPAVSNSSASAIGATSVMLNGTVNDNNAFTTVSFDYGISAFYGATASATNGGSISAGTGATNSSVALSSLACNTSYHFRVKATNSVGTSYGSDNAFTTAACVPGAPTIIWVRAGNAQASIGFAPPISDGGSPVTSYAVTPGYGQAVSGNEIPITVPNLNNGAAYSFTVTATNAVGTGPASVAWERVIPGIAVVDDADATGYQLLQNAYNADSSGKKIKILAETVVGGLTVTSSNDRGFITITGGCNNDFSDDNGLPSILNKVTLSAGTTRFRNVIVRTP